MKLAVTQLAEGDSFFRFSSGKDAWVREVIQDVAREGYELKSDMSLEVQLTKLEPDYYLRGSMGFKVDQVCARCAEVFPLELTHQFSVALAHASQTKAPTPALSEESDELDVLFFEGHEIDLAPIFREQFFLSLPYQSLCGADCKGVCQMCGTNLNVGSCGCAKAKKLTPFSVLEKIQH